MFIFMVTNTQLTLFSSNVFVYMQVVIYFMSLSFFVITRIIKQQFNVHVRAHRLLFSGGHLFYNHLNLIYCYLSFTVVVN